MSLPIRRNCAAGFGHLRQRVRHSGGFGDVAVTNFTVRFGVHHHAGLGRQLGERHLPGLGGIGEQHLARLRAGEPHRQIVPGDRIAADGLLLIVELRIAVKLVAGVEILRQHQGNRGLGALTHFGGR
jgi:hypothetical protein